MGLSLNQKRTKGDRGKVEGLTPLLYPDRFWVFMLRMDLNKNDRGDRSDRGRKQLLPFFIKGMSCCLGTTTTP